MHFQNYRQGTRFVNDRLNSQNNLSETKEQQVTQYIGGLRVVIQDQVTFHTVWTLLEVINLVVKIEMQLALQLTRLQP